tara:strand:- start:5179 stop:6912 length:1734 start_codon:yes stop_codon:yes gene_type:complete
MIILGLNIFHADTSAALIIDGELVSAIEEERFTKIKHYAGLPLNSIKHCLNASNLSISEVDIISVNFNSKYNFLNKALFTFKNINMSTVTKIASLHKKNSIKKILEANFSKEINAKIVYIPHHIAHIASGYFLSGLNNAIGLTIDGSGDFSTSESFILENNSIKLIKKNIYPHSLGIFYQTFTQFLGFMNYGDEYKFMGLSSYGVPKYLNRLKKIITYNDKGDFKLNLKYFNFHKDSLNFNFSNNNPFFSEFFNNSFIELFGNQRSIDHKFTDYHKDLAASVQKIFEEIIILKIKFLKKKFDEPNIVLSGGCFFNSILNGKIHDLKLFENISISPFVGDAGGAVGAALYYIRNNENFKNVPLKTSYLGSSYSNEFIKSNVIEQRDLDNSKSINYQYFEDFSELTSLISKKILENNLVGWFQGKSEFGPRALGNRSLLGNPKNPQMKKIINEKIKKRENFRPFAAIILEEYYKDYFYQEFPSPFMSFVFKVKKKAIREIPAVLHIDNTSRVQTINKQQNPKIYDLLSKFNEISGVPALLNTSLNINEPINNDPNTAFETYTNSNIDILVMENYVFYKK